MLVDEVRIDGLPSTEPVAGMDIGWVKIKYGDRITLLENIDCAHVLSFGTKQIEIIEALKVSPDYLLGPLVETHVDNELNTIVERVKRICDSKEDREAINLLIHRYKLPAREKLSRKTKKNT
jgi:hypothetical protein